MKMVREVFFLSIEYLKKRGVASPRKEAELLLSSVLAISRLDLYMQLDKPLLENEIIQFREVIRRRGVGEPWQYIVGSVEFLGCTIKVNPTVLIPRQETEILVDKIVQELPSKPLEIWDICAGSGCIGIAIKKKRGDCTVVLSDIDEGVLQVAKENAKANQVEVECVLGDLLEPFHEKKADIIICNPPYISAQEYLFLDREVRDWEPKRALVGGGTGYEFYEKMAQSLRKFVHPGGVVYFEIGHQMGERIKKIFDHLGRSELLKDWASHDRYYKVEIE